MRSNAVPTGARRPGGIEQATDDRREIPDGTKYPSVTLERGFTSDRDYVAWAKGALATELVLGSSSMTRAVM